MKSTNKVITFFNDSIFVINSDNNRTKISESKKKRCKNITFLVLPYVFPSGLPFDNLNLYVVTESNDTLLINKSKSDPKMTNTYVIKNNTVIKSFWFEYSKMKMEEYFVKSKKSNRFGIFLYSGKLFHNEQVTIIDKNTIKINSTNTIFHRAKNHPIGVKPLKNIL